MPSRRMIATGVGAAAAGAFPVSPSKAEWRAQPTEPAFAVQREGNTEEAFSSPLDALYEPGTFACTGCANPAYDAADEFDSGTGWPSFTRATPADAVGTRPDPKLMGLATEVFCARCGGHLGHVFEDGPPPTGLRHCIDGVALRFAAAA